MLYRMGWLVAVNYERQIGCATVWTEYKLFTVWKIKLKSMDSKIS